MEHKDVMIKNVSQLENSRMAYKDSDGYKDLDSLMRSIDQNGLLQPIGLAPVGKNKYQVAYGNRRFVAAEKLGWKKIPAMILDVGESEADVYIKNAIENIQRKDPLPVEEGRIFLQMTEELDMTMSEVAARIGIPIGRVRSSVGLFKTVPEQFRKKVKNRKPGMAKKGEIAGHLAKQIIQNKRILKLNATQTNQLFRAAQEDGTSYVNINQMAKAMAAGKPAAKVEEIKKMKMLTIRVLMDRKDIEKIQKKSGMGIDEYIENALVEGTKVPIIPNVRRKKKKAS